MTIWPEGKTSAVLVTINLDGERALLAEHPELSESDKTLSTLRYGIRRGVPALLGELERARIPATWFLPGETARAIPGVARRIAESHDVGMRGDDLLPLSGVPADVRRTRLRRGVAAFEAAGIAPRGFRLPRGEWPQGLVDDLSDLGFSWSSSFAADDLPFLLPGRRGTDLVEIPFHYAAEDRQAFEWNFSPAMPAGHARIATYDDVLENWVWEFEGARSESSMFVLTLHPHVIGTPGRLPLLRKLLARMTEHEDVWFTTGSSLAEFWRASGPERGSGHPARVFLEESAWISY